MDRMLTGKDRRGLDALYGRFLRLRRYGMPRKLVTTFRAKRGALKARRYARYRALEAEDMRPRRPRAWRARGRSG